MTGHRDPYVGAGADGARRSALIDLEEAELLPTGPHQDGYSEATEERKAELRASAVRWSEQARELEDLDVVDAAMDSGAAG